MPEPLTIRQRIEAALRKETIIHGASLMSREARDEIHIEQRAGHVLAALAPEGVPIEDFGRWKSVEERIFTTFNAHDERLQGLAARIDMHAIEERLAALEARPVVGTVEHVGPMFITCRRCNGTGTIQCLPSANNGQWMKTCDACNGQKVVRV